MRRAIATLLALAAPACVLATDFDSFLGGAGGGGVDTGSEGGAVTPDDAGEARGDAGDAAPSSTYAAAVQADFPYLYYRLGEPTTTKAVHDSSSRKKDAAILGKVTFGQPGAIAGDGDTAIHLDGTGAVYVSGQAEFAKNAAFSIEAWVKADPIPGSDGQGHVIAATERGNDNGWALFFYRDRHPQLERETANEDDICNSGVDTPETDYTYVVGTYDGAKLRVYVNGVLAATETSSAPIPGGANVPFAIGGGDDGTTNTFKGDIDEIAVYDYALTQDHVSRHYKAAGH